MKEAFTRSRGNSQLSNIGSSLLRLDDKQIYNKQRSKFDIISQKPVQHNQTIKMYPKLSVQDKDAYYFKRMAKAQLIQPPNSNLNPPNNTNKGQTNAGRYTYEADNNKVALDLWQSYQGKGKVNSHQQFRPQMLNHADEFRSLM